MRIFYSRKFDKQYRKQNQKIKVMFETRMGIFIRNPNDTRLSIHKLSGKLEGLWSLNVNGDIRVIFDKSQENAVILVAIGSHSELYS